VYTICVYVCVSLRRKPRQIEIIFLVYVGYGKRACFTVERVYSFIAWFWIINIYLLASVERREEDGVLFPAALPRISNATQHLEYGSRGIPCPRII